MKENPLDTIYTAVQELVRPRTHNQTVTAYVDREWRSASRRIEIPSLIDQLEAAFISSSGDQAGSGFASKPAARIDAMDTLMRIDTEAGNWVDQLGHTIAPDVRDNLRWLNQHAAKLKDLEQVEWLAKDIHGWATISRVVTGWDVGAFRPYNTCPLCAKRGGLRIRVIENGAHAACLNCHETWTPDTIGLLSQHILDEDESPAGVIVPVEPIEVRCGFCSAEPGFPCLTGLFREEAEPHQSRRALAAAGLILQEAS